MDLGLRGKGRVVAAFGDVDVLVANVEGPPPGPFERRGVTLDEQIASQSEDIPAGRVGTPEEFASMMVFPASERAPYVTGAAIQVDGGLIRSNV